MLFRLKHGIDPFELNPGAQAIEEFASLTDKQFFFTCLVADVDHDNPLHTLPDNQKRTKAAAIAGYGMEENRPDKNARNLIGGKVASVEKAIAKYRELQFDEDKANLAAVDRQILESRAFLEKDKWEMSGKDPKTFSTLMKDAVKLGQDLPKLVETKRELLRVIKSKEQVQLGIVTNTAADITESEQEQMDASDEPMSTIDVVMAKDNAVNGYRE